MHWHRNKMYAARGKQGNVVSYFDNVITAAEEFYAKLCGTQESHEAATRCSCREEMQVP